MFPATLLCVSHRPMFMCFRLHLFVCPLNMLEPAQIRRPNLPGSGWPEPGRKILAHRLASETDPFGHNLTWPSRTKSRAGRMCKHRSDSDPIMMIRAIFSAGKKQPIRRIRQIGSGPIPAGRNGHNWPDPKRVRAGSGMFTGCPCSRFRRPLFVFR